MAQDLRTDPKLRAYLKAGEPTHGKSDGAGLKFTLKAIAEVFFPQFVVNRLRIWWRTRAFANDYLRSVGWQPSVMVRAAVDNNGPAPWITFPARKMIERVIEPGFKVFEYGSGGSSLWWAARVSEVASVEHDREWSAKLIAKAPRNLTVITREQSSSYVDTSRLLNSFLSRYPDVTGAHRSLNSSDYAAYALEITKYGKGYFDIVVIDGMARVFTAWLAGQYVKGSGVILFDNSDRPDYNEGYRALAEMGFKRIDFYGPGPANSYEWATSIFCKQFEWLSKNVVIPETQKCDID